MELLPTPLAGLMLMRPRVFGDDRGYFFEPFNQRTFRQVTGLDVDFVQDNESRSDAGTLRGLHLQRGEHAQAKLVRVAAGAVLDVCVDVREDSPTFGRHWSVRLDDREHLILYVPAGMAHGFIALENGTVFNYKCSRYYHPPAECIVRWDDPDLAIDWGVNDPLVSDRDRAGRLFAEKPWRN